MSSSRRAVEPAVPDRPGCRLFAVPIGSVARRTSAEQSMLDSPSLVRR